MGIGGSKNTKSDICISPQAYPIPFDYTKWYLKYFGPSCLCHHPYSVRLSVSILEAELFIKERQHCYGSIEHCNIGMVEYADSSFVRQQFTISITSQVGQLCMCSVQGPVTLANLTHF